MTSKCHVELRYADGQPLLFDASDIAFVEIGDDGDLMINLHSAPSWVFQLPTKYEKLIELLDQAGIKTFKEGST